MKSPFSSIGIIRKIRRGEVTFGLREAIILAIIGIAIAVVAAVRNG